MKVTPLPTIRRLSESNARNPAENLPTAVQAEYDTGTPVDRERPKKLRNNAMHDERRSPVF